MSRKRGHHTSPSSTHGGESPSDEGGAGAERLQKVLAAAGIGSRRDCEELIREGRVEVDRQTVTELGTRVDPLTQEIRVDGEALRRPKRIYFAVNKPAGVVTTNYDPSGRERVVDLVPTEERVFAVGRLDRASEGLILVTNDGEFANRLTHPRYGIPKTYLVRVAGSPSQQELAKLRRGVHLSDGPCRVESLQVKGKHKGSTDMVIVLNEGKNREIRRILARVGHKVVRLKRIAVGRLKLSDLPVGAWRKLSPPEVQMLLSEAKERKRAQRKPKPPRGTSKPVQGPRQRSPYFEKQAAMGPFPRPAETDESWEPDDELLEIAGDGLVEITEGEAAGDPAPLGDVIDYEAAPVRHPRPSTGGRPGAKASGRGRQRGRQQARKESSPGRRPPQDRRPAKQRRKGRR